jgi:hypothetical protein
VIDGSWQDGTVKQEPQSEEEQSSSKPKAKQRKAKKAGHSLQHSAAADAPPGFLQDVLRTTGY